MSLSETQWALLRCLADGQCRSGEELGRLLGISRAAIWKHLQPLQALGIQVASQRGRGYQLAGPLSLLSREDILHFGGAPLEALLARVEVVATIDSTNSALLRRAATESLGGLALLAEQQSLGRGRRGRTWVSPFACNLYFSVGWQFERGVACLEGLSLAVGVVLLEALNDLGVAGLSLKWPNDLLLDGRKLGGILLEIGGDLSGQCHLVLGVGLNLAMSSQQAAGIDQAWAVLSERLPHINRNQLAAQLLVPLAQLLASYETSGFAPYRQRWEAHNAFRNARVCVLGGVEPLEGICRDLSATGALRVETARGLIELQGGEISLRGQL